MFGDLLNLFSGGQSKGYDSLMGNIEQGMRERQQYGNQANDALKQYGQNAIGARQQYGQNAMDAMRQHGGQANNMLAPWQQAGLGQLNPYMKNYERMLDPNKFISDQMSGYMESPWAKMQMAKGQNAISNAASAGGGLGGTNYMADMGDYARNTTAADQQNYLNNAMNVWNGGLERQGNMAGMGFNAAGQMGNNFMNMGNNIGNMYGNMGSGIAGDYSGMGSGISQNLMGIGQGMASDYGDRGRAELEKSKSEQSGWQNLIGGYLNPIKAAMGGR